MVGSANCYDVILRSIFNPCIKISHSFYDYESHPGIK